MFLAPHKPRKPLHLFAAATLTALFMLVGCGGEREGGALEGAIDKGRDLFTEDESEQGRSSKPPNVEVYTNIAKPDGRYTMVGHVNDDTEIRGVQIVAEFTCPGVEAKCVEGQKLRQIHDLSPPFENFVWETTLPQDQITYEVRAADEDGFGPAHTVVVRRDNPDDSDHYIFEEEDLRALRRKHGTSLVGNLYIEGIDDLEDLQSLRGLEQVTGEISISGNPDLVSLRGLDQLARTRVLKIAGNAKLADARSLARLNNAEHIIIAGPSQLGDLSGLAGIETLPRLTLEGTIGIQELSGMTNLKRVDILELIASREVTNLTGLGGIEHIETLSLSANRNLVYLVGLSPDLSLRHLVSYRNVAQLSFRGFPANLEELGTLSVEDADAMVQLTGLERVRTAFQIEIVHNNLLESITGLSGLEEVEEFTVTKNRALPQCEAKKFASQRSENARVSNNAAGGSCE